MALQRGNKTETKGLRSIPLHNVGLGLILNRLTKKLNEFSEASLVLNKGIPFFKETMRKSLEIEFQEVIQIRELLKYAKENFSKNVDDNWALTCLSTVLLEPVIRNTLEEMGSDSKGKFTEITSRLSKEARRWESK